MDWTVIRESLLSMLLVPSLSAKLLIFMARIAMYSFAHILDCLLERTKKEKKILCLTMQYWKGKGCYLVKSCTRMVMVIIHCYLCSAREDSATRT